MTACEIHLHGVGVPDSHLSPLHVMLICLPCLLCSTHLAFFASMLSCCTLAYMFMHESVCRPYFNPMSYAHSIQTCIFPPRTLPFCLKTRFFASLCASHVCLPHLASFPSLSLACFSFCLFLCLSTSLFLLSLHDGARILGARCDLLGGSKKGKMQARRCKPTKGNVQ